MDRITTPIENLLREKLLLWTNDYLRTSSRIRQLRKSKSLVDFHKSRLGRQTRTSYGFNRYWVWETDTWTVSISNIRGIGFEVPEGTTVKDALAAWEDYKLRMKLDEST